MKVLVIGGTGFIGSRLVKLLSKNGYYVRVLSRTRSLIGLNANNDYIEVTQCDLLDSSFELEKVIVDCSVVFNCVGELHNESIMEQLHVDATLRLVLACKKIANISGQPIHWVQLSSVGAYGSYPRVASFDRDVTEDTVPAPVAIYEITKTKADELIATESEPGVFSYSILRPSNVYGPFMPNNSIRQWGRVIQKKLFFYIGFHEAVSTYVHVDDVVDALMLCGFDERAKGEIFNISNDCSQVDIVNTIAKQFNVVEPTLRVPEGFIRLISVLFSKIKGFPLSHSRINALVARTRYPTDKLSSVLDYQPSRDVKDTIAEVFLDIDMLNDNN